MIRQIRYFQSVVRHNSFSEAAEECHISQSAISQQIQALERAFSDQYVNLILTVGNQYIEISSRNPIASLPRVTPQELKNIPCILVSSREQRENEQEYYQRVVGFQGDFLYAENLEEVRLMVIGGQGFMPVEGVKRAGNFGSSISRIPLFRGDSQITRNYCAFWKQGNSGYYVEEFAEILKRKFD